MSEALRAMESAETPRTTPATVEQMLKNPQYLEAIQRAIPAHMTPTKIASFALNALRKTPNLSKCDQVSLFGSIITCSQNGWEIGKDVHLLPFHNRKAGRMDCTVVPDYRGLIKLAIQSEQVSKVEAHVVHENDLFEYELGMNEILRHRPEMRDRGGFLCVYAIVTLSDGAKQYEVMTYEDVMDIRNRSKSKDSGPWVTDFDMMARKTAIKRILRYVGSSTEVQKFVDLDNQRETGDQDHTSWAKDANIIEGEATEVRDEKPAPDNNTEKPAAKKRARRTKAEMEAARQAELEEQQAPVGENNQTGASENAGGNGQAEPDQLTFAKVAEFINETDDSEQSRAMINSARGQVPDDQIQELIKVHLAKFLPKEKQ